LSKHSHYLFTRYFQGDQIKAFEIPRTCSMHGDEICEILVRKSEGKTVLGKLRCRWEDNIKMDLRETLCGNVDILFKILY
jgi:hypothetical protein